MNLPTDIWVIVDEYGDTKSKCNLRLTCQLTFSTTKIEKIYIKDKLTCLVRFNEMFPYLKTVYCKHKDYLSDNFWPYNFVVDNLIYFHTYITNDHVCIRPPQFFKDIQFDVVGCAFSHMYDDEDSSADDTTLILAVKVSSPHTESVNLRISGDICELLVSATSHNRLKVLNVSTHYSLIVRTMHVSLLITREASFDLLDDDCVHL